MDAITSEADIPVDPTIIEVISAASTLPTDTESGDGMSAGPSVSLTIVEESILSAASHARSKMAQRYNKRFVIENFENDTIVALYIPKEDRATLDLPRLYARIVAQPHPGRYQLQTQHGILNRLYPTGELNRVSSLIGMFHALI